MSVSEPPGPGLGESALDARVSERPRMLSVFDLTDDDQDLLLDLAEVAIRASVAGTQFPGLGSGQIPESLRRPCHAFVNLHLGSEFYGCQRGLDEAAPLGQCVSQLAQRAAFEVGRDYQLAEGDLGSIHIEISVAESRTAIAASTRAVALSQIAQNRDGVRIESMGQSAVSLAAEWKDRPDPDDFLDHLMIGAGLNPEVWPDDMTVELLKTADFGRFLH